MFKKSLKDEVLEVIKERIEEQRNIISSSWPGETRNAALRNLKLYRILYLITKRT